MIRLSPLPVAHVGRFRQYNGRLALFRPSRELDAYWQKHWADPARRTWYMAQGRSEDLGEYETVVSRYVPKALSVIEAGCGLAQVVAILKARGYRAIGIENDRQVVDFVNTARPDLDVRLGDIRALDLPSGSVGCYLSLGVVEHFAEGPWKVLAEARRVVHPAGVALISVPYVNPIRRSYLAKIGSDAATGTAEQLDFYQYYFDCADFISILHDSGFQVVERLPLFAERYLTWEHPIVARYWKSRFCRWRMKRLARQALRTAPLVFKKRYAHMMMYVCRPGEISLAPNACFT